MESTLKGKEQVKLDFIPLDFDYLDLDGKCHIRMFGRTSENKRCCVLDTTDAYFWLFPRAGIDLKKYAEKVAKISLEHASRIAKVEKVEIKDKHFLGNPIKALQVFVSNPKDIAVIKDIAKTFHETLEKKETDINFVTRYIIDKNVKPLEWVHVEGRELNQYIEVPFDVDTDIVVMADEIKPTQEHELKLNFLAFDIESTEFEIGKGEIVMISLADHNFHKVLTWKKYSNAPEEVEFVKDEAELIEKFMKIIHERKPDFLVGYFSDGFDLPYLRARAEQNHIKLDLGLDKSNLSFSRGIMPSAKITGRVHIDLYRFVNNIFAYTLQSPTISLNDVAKELIGEEKLEIDLGHITKELRSTHGKIKDAEMRRFSLYNLQDAVLTSKLFLKLWNNLAELTKVVSEPLFEVSRARYAYLVENNILHNLKRFNEIAASRPLGEEIGERREREKYIGAFVKEPRPDVYEKVAVFDFRSFWPSIIVSFNISMPTLLEKKESGGYETPEFEFDGKKRKFYFQKQEGFIPRILKELLEKRKETKAEFKRNPSPVLEAKDYALKTLANATYGYFGFFGARYYSPECGASITAISRYYIHKTIDEIEKFGFEVIYSDTDSVMFALGNKTEKDAKEILEKINKTLPGTMELELENFYVRGIFVMTKKGKTGAKKKYALLAKDGNIKIRGFEAVRRDRCDLAKETQDVVLKKVLEEGKADNALAYVIKILKEVREKKAPIEKLIIRTKLKKAIESYETRGPHVVVAEKMLEQGLPVKAGSLIEYVIAKGNSKERIRERAKLPDEVEKGGYDIDYYIEHQIVPAVETIFAVFGITKEQIIEGKKQKNLGEF